MAMEAAYPSLIAHSHTGEQERKILLQLQDWAVYLETHTLDNLDSVAFEFL